MKTFLALMLCAAVAGAEEERAWCGGHRVFEDECGICSPGLLASLAPGSGLKIRFNAKESAAKAGVRVAAPRVGAMADGVECYAEIQFDQNRLAQITAPVAGIVQSVEVDLGSRVEEGAVLARLGSAEIAKARLAKQNLERERKLRAERISSEKDLQEAEAEYEQLKSMGFDRVDDAGLLQLQAPFAGEVVERSAVRGARVEAGTPMFTIADRSTMWAMLNIPEKQLARVRVGQTVELRVDALPERTFTGKLTWIAAQVDDRTRMVRARAEVPNPDGALKAQMFARARILTGNSENAVIIPQSALQLHDGRAFVFVRLDDDLFEARAVRVGAKHNGDVEILSGLAAEEPVAVAQSFVVKSQLLISRLGAGCAD